MEKNIFESLDVQGVEEQWHKWGMKQGNGAALDGRHTLKEDLSTNGGKTIKQRETKAEYNNKRRGRLGMYP